MSGQTVICFGEILWDSLPQAIHPGGAPVNVAYHLNRFGLNAVPVTAVGTDFLGDEMLRRFKYWNVTPEHVGRVDKPTGAVVVDLKENGIPEYRFLDDVAWDFIPLPGALDSLCKPAIAIVFGTLAQRSAHNVRQLANLRAVLSHARHVFDVNLRAPHDDHDAVWRLAKGCDLIKLNDDELGRLMGLRVDSETIGDGARRFAERTACAKVCVTAGSRGAGLWWDGHWHWEPAQPITVRDTVGAGDSFLAALLHGWLVNELAPDANLRRASRVAEFVAGCDGAMPDYRLNERGLPFRP